MLDAPQLDADDDDAHPDDGTDDDGDCPCCACRGEVDGHEYEYDDEED